MTAVSPSEPFVTPAALSAFLRSVERRGFVVALLQCGDEVCAGQALASVVRMFRGHAGQVLMADWPVRFWRLVVTAPALSAARLGHDGPAPFDALATISPRDRLALLLRIVAGLDEPMASDVLGIGEDDYRQALARACPRTPEGQPDAMAWRALAEAAQRQVRELSPQRLERLTLLREATRIDPSRPVRTDGPGPKLVAPERTEHRPLRRQSRQGPRLNGLLGVGRAPWAVAASIGALTVLLWWWWQRPPTLPADPVSQALPGALHVVDAGPVLVERLPGTDVAPTHDVGPSSDPYDVAMLVDPELALARQSDFYAWFAAGGPVPVDESESRPVVAQPASAGLETVDDEN